MYKFINFCFLLSIFTLLINNVAAKNLLEKTGEVQDKEGFYMVFIENNSSTASVEKRQENVDGETTEEYVDSVIDEIHNLIMGNKDIYKDQEKFEEIEIQDSKLKKRDSETHYLLDYGDSSYVYQVANLQNTTLINAYLTPELVGTVRSMPNVVSVSLPSEYKPSNDDDTYADILKETKWKKLDINYFSELHLSLISQGKFSDNLIDEYDTNYYHPESAGDDIDIFIFDTGFNFDGGEFSNKHYERKVECSFYVKNAKISEVENKDFCLSTYYDPLGYMDKNHGTMVATIAGGMTYGIAKKANIYGILMERYYNEDVIAGLKYVRDNLFRPGKAVFNFSFTGYAYIHKLTSEPIHAELQALIKELSEQGAVFVSAAGNDSCDTYDLYNGEIVAAHPCAYENEICVGGIANDVKSKFMNSTLYKLDKESNFGEVVDIYAPYHVKVGYSDVNHKNINKYACGTSFSSPIVAGIAASIMSENPDVKYTSNSMIKYLTQIGEKDIISGIPKGYPNIFVNNGKRTVLSSNNIYHGCGVHSGNKKCSNDECCSVDGHCSSDKNVCEISH